MGRGITYNQAARTVSVRPKADKYLLELQEQSFASDATQLLYREDEDFNISQNGLYKTHDEQKHKLWVHKTKGKPPMPSKFFHKTQSEGEWDIYEPLARFDGKEHNGLQGDNDCGYYAAALAYDDGDWRKGYNLAKMYDAHTLKKYGTSGQTSEGYDKDFKDMYYNANPAVGEAYFIYASAERKKEERMNCKINHHMATVVAQDGEDNITSEADVNDSRAMPYFKMYATKQKNQTFFGEHSYVYSSAEGMRKRNRADASLAHLVTKSTRDAKVLGNEPIKSAVPKKK